MALSAVAATFTANTAPLDAALARTQAQVSATASRIESASNGMSSSFQKADGSMTRSANRIADSAATIGTAFAVAGAGLAIGLGFAVKKAADFEQEIQNAGVISGATAKDFERLRQEALKLGATSSKSATEIATAYTEMARAGFDVNEVIKAMPAIVSAAEAANEDLARTSEVVASALNGFGMEASEAGRIADIMSEAANRSAAGIDDMGFAFSYAAPLAKVLGISIEELAAATGILADSGIKGTSAGTGLASVMNDLTDITPKAQKEINNLGVELYDQNGNLKSLSGIVQEFSDKTSHLTSVQKAAALATIFEVDSTKVMLTLMEQGPSKINDFAKALENSGGSAEATAKKMKDTLQGSLLELYGAFETMQIIIGTTLAPAIEFVAYTLKSLINWFNELPQPIQSFIVIGTAVVAILLILAGVVAFVIAGIAALVVAVGAISGTVGLVILAIVAAIAQFLAIGAALVYAYKKFEWFRNMVNQVWAGIKEGFQSVVEYLKPAVAAVVHFINEQWNKVKAWWDENGPTIITTIQNVWNFISEIVKAGMDNIIPIMQAAWGIVESIVISTWDIIKLIIGTGIDWILTVVELFTNLFTGNWKGVWESAKKLVLLYLNFIYNFIKIIFKGILDTIKSVMNYSYTVVSTVWKNMWSVISSILKSIYNFVSSTWDSILKKISDKVDSIKKSVSDGFNSVGKIVDEITTKVKDKLSGMAGDAYNWGKNLINMFADGIKAAGKAVIDEARRIANTVKQYLGFASPTEKGPASDSDKWAPNFIDMFSMGLEKGIPKIDAAMRGLGFGMSSITNPEGQLLTPNLTRNSEIEQQPNTGVTLNNCTFIVRDENDVSKIAREWDRLQQIHMRSKGMVGI